jgi:aryl carrier-like protein
LTVAREDKPGEKRLVAYCIPTPGRRVNQAELLSFLSARLPDYMRPSRLVEVDRFPQAPNGKIDRMALPAPDTERPQLERAYAPPTTSEEKALAEVWREVFGLDRVGIHDNFFDLGGDSMLAVQMVVRANQRDLNITFRQLLDRQTIADLAANCGLSRADSPERMPWSNRAPHVDSSGAGEILALVARTTGLPDLQPAENLMQRGASSLDIMQVASVLEQELGFRPDIDQFCSTPTVAFLSETYVRQIGIGRAAEARRRTDNQSTGPDIRDGLWGNN